MGNRVVSIGVDPKFFDNVFERERRKLEKEKGISFSQRTFTAFLEKKKVKFVFPKPDNRFIIPKGRKKK